MIRDLFRRRRRGLEEVEDLHHAGSNHNDKEKGNQRLADSRLVLFSLGGLSNRDAAALVNVLVELLVAVANVAWKGLIRGEWRRGARVSKKMASRQKRQKANGGRKRLVIS